MSKTNEPMYKHPLYTAWQSMIYRCHGKDTKGNPNYRKYGGRGIYVCKEWRDSFRKFASDMGDRPKGHSLDRIDNDGPYSKENCRWATQLTQSLNKRPSKKGTNKYKGVYKNPRKKRFEVKIAFDRKFYHVGYFDTEIEAAKAFDKTYRKLYGHSMGVNFK